MLRRLILVATAGLVLSASNADAEEPVHRIGDPAWPPRTPERTQALLERLGERGYVVGLAARYRLPAMYLNQPNVQNGGVMSYGPNTLDFWHSAAAYVDKFLKGERPGDLPVEQPTQFYLIVNLKTAAALGITFPSLILAQADEVIE